MDLIEPNELKRLQDIRLRAAIPEAQLSGFYRERYEAAGLDPTRVNGVDGLSKIPFTTKSDLVLEQTEHPPHGRLMTRPPSLFRYLHQTSGTTGRPLIWLDTEESWRWWVHCWGYVYRAAGVSESDVVFCAFSFGPYISHWSAIAGARGVGALAVSGGGMASEVRLRTIIESGATVLVCTPTYALHLIEVARERGIDLGGSRLRVSIHAGEPGASLANVRRLIEDGLGTRCFDHAGATEVGAWAFECDSRAGAMHLNEAEFVFEVVDPATLAPVPEGTRGELVVTNLGRIGMPVVRYRTGDLVELTSEPCSCGRGFARVRGGLLGRSDDMIVVRGVNVYPSAIDNLIRGLAGVAEYEVLIRRVSGMDDLTVRVELLDGGRFDLAGGELARAFREQLNLRVAIEQVPFGSLPRYEFKARRFKRVGSS